MNLRMTNDGLRLRFSPEEFARLYGQGHYGERLCLYDVEITLGQSAETATCFELADDSLRLQVARERLAPLSTAKPPRDGVVFHCTLPKGNTLAVGLEVDLKG